ncbi:MAG: hypothetical protein L0322_24785, partial [Chloroflexi bacterium]|nr:hypothetical protein [Chloroflexota bacterium]
MNNKRLTISLLLVAAAAVLLFGGQQALAAGRQPPPVANDDSYTAGENTPLVRSFALGVLANDDDGDGEALAAQLA